MYCNPAFLDEEYGKSSWQKPVLYDKIYKSNSQKSVESRRFYALFCSSQFSGSFLSDKDSNINYLKEDFMNQSENSQFLGTEKISKLMLKFSVPCVLSLLVSALYNIVILFLSFLFCLIFLESRVSCLLHRLRILLLWSWRRFWLWHLCGR